MHVATAPERESRAAYGIQAISRAATLMRLIARGGEEGIRLTDLTHMTGYPHPTIRRFLKSLIDERFVCQDAQSRRYFIGPMSFELGLGTRFKPAFQEDFRPHLQELAAVSGCTAYLIMRSGSDAVCLDRIQSDPPVKTSPFGIGGRRPLGIGAGSISILASLCDAEIKRALHSNRRDLESYGRVTIPSVWRAIERARARKFAFTKNIHTYGVSSIGVLIRRRGNPADYAVSLLTREKLTEARVRDLFRAMTSELKKMKR